MFLPKRSVFLRSCVVKLFMFVFVFVLLITSTNYLQAINESEINSIRSMSEEELLRELQIDNLRADFSNCSETFSVGAHGNDSYVHHRVDRLGDFVSYSTDYKPSWDSSIWSSNFRLNGVKASKAFWKDILFFTGEVMAIYRLRKAHLGFNFLTNWTLDVHTNPYNSSFTTVYKRGNEGIDAVVGTLRVISSDVREKLPLEKFLDIGLKTEGFEKYEIGLLTIEKLPSSMEDKKRILLELWVNLVSFFREKNKQEIRLYAFSDKFCTRLYRGWGFVPVKEFYKHGLLVQNDETHKDMLKLEQGPNMEVLTYVLSKESLVQLLSRASGGMLTINSSIVQERLNNLGLNSFFEYSSSL